MTRASLTRLRRSGAGQRGPWSVALLCLIAAGCNGDDSAQKINGSVHIAAGTAPGAADTVNGAIDIADDATVTVANTVNGGIHLGTHATADSLNAVNGNITVGAGAHVAKAAESVNGGVAVGEGATVLGAVANVNGKIEITGAHVAGGIKTDNGSIAIFGASRVEGGIWVQKTSQVIHFGDDIPRIEIGAGAVIQGELRFDRPVKLYVSDKATIGPVTGATPISFSGATPPAG